MDRSVFNKAHAAVYALMDYKLLILRERINMGLTAEEKAERDAQKAAQAAEAKADEVQSNQDAPGQTTYDDRHSGIEGE